jgi:hypothetical protein
VSKILARSVYRSLMRFEPQKRRHHSEGGHRMAAINPMSYGPWSLQLLPDVIASANTRMDVTVCAKPGTRKQE